MEDFNGLLQAVHNLSPSVDVRYEFLRNASLDTYALRLTDPIFADVEAAREYLEAQRWPNGAICPHCGGTDKNTKLEGKAHRPGLYQCGDCREQFTVTVGTVFERSKVPLNKWLLATHLMASSKKGMSAHQLHRSIGVTYKTAWFMFHRIREAMRNDEPGNFGSGGGIVEVDETFIGRNKAKDVKPGAPWSSQIFERRMHAIEQLLTRTLLGWNVPRRVAGALAAESARTTNDEFDREGRKMNWKCNPIRRSWPIAPPVALMTAAMLSGTAAMSFAQDGPPGLTEPTVFAPFDPDAPEMQPASGFDQGSGLRAGQRAGVHAGRRSWPGGGRQGPGARISPRRSEQRRGQDGRPGSAILVLKSRSRRRCASRPGILEPQPSGNHVVGRAMSVRSYRRRRPRFSTRRNMRRARR